MTIKNISSFKMTKALIQVLLLTLVLVFAVGIDDISATSGDTIYVNDTGGDDDNDGSDWSTAKKTIKNATGSVNVNGIVNIANGQYSGTSNTGITIDKNMTINGESQTGTIINGTGINWIFHVNQGINFTLNNLTITNATGSDGAVIYNNDGSVYVSDCSFIDNTATFAGGGVIYNNVGSVYVSDCSFIGNTATSYGGAIYNYGNVYVSDSSFTSNTAIIGGVIYNDGGESVLTGCSFIGNTAFYGGVIYNDIGSIYVSDSSFIGNTANYGGVIVNPYDSSVSVTNSSFSGNTANYYGGAIYNDGGGGGGALSVIGTSFTGNIAFYYGGAIYNDGSESVVTSCSFTGNTAFSTGGAIYNTRTLTVTDSIFTDNTATNGGAIYNLGRLTANFNRIVGNYPTAIHNFGLFVDVLYNWWGSNNPDFTTLISGVVDYSPWLYMTLQTNPTNIVQGDVSTLTASFNNAFDGTTVTPLNPDNGHIPDKTPVTFSTDLGSLGSKTINKETMEGIATATLTADETPGIAHVNSVTDAQTVNNEVIINPKSSLYLTITPSKTNPMVGDTVIYTLKVGNKGPNTAENVVMTYTIPEGLEFAGAQVDNGTYTYDPKTRTITWTIGDVPVADPFMWLSLKVLSSGTYLINPTLSTSTYDPTLNANTQTLIINAAATPNNNNTNNNNANKTNNTVNAATNTVTMQDTGIPLILLIMALFLVIGGLVSSKK